MAKLRIATMAAMAALAIAAALVALDLETTRALAVSPPQNPMSSSGFQGAWCAHCDPRQAMLHQQQRSVSYADQ